MVLLRLRPRDETRVSAHQATQLAGASDEREWKGVLVEKPPLTVARQFGGGVHAITSGSSTMLSSFPTRVRVKMRFAVPRGLTTTSSTAPARAL